MHYQISGTASNGVDYAFLSGSVTFEQWEYSIAVVIDPLADSELEGVETITLTLVPTITYIVVTNSAAVTVLLDDTSTTLGVSKVLDAWEPNSLNNQAGSVGYFEFHRSDTRGLAPEMAYPYVVTGTAQMGADYTNLTGVVVFPPFENNVAVYVQGLDDTLTEGVETVVLTLPLTNNIRIDPASSSATLNLADNPLQLAFRVVAHLNSPVGIDYSPSENALLVSVRGGFGGMPYAFVRIGTNNTGALTVTNWSGITNLVDEVKLATAKLTTNGFTAGQMFFGNNGLTNRIGWVAADGTSSNMSFSVLTNDTFIRGGLHVDQSGSFGGDLVAVTGDTPLRGGGIWRMTASSTPTLLTNLSNVHLEGVITLTNDVQKWGPWAGRILTGGESVTPEPEICAVSASGNVITNKLGIAPEDFDIIPANQDLYCVNQSSGTIEKLSKFFLTDYVGDLLITQSGEFYGGPTLFIVHWNPTNSVFEKISISHPGGLEHVSSAPINLPIQ